MYPTCFSGSYWYYPMFHLSGVYIWQSLSTVLFLLKHIILQSKWLYTCGHRHLLRIWQTVLWSIVTILMGPALIQIRAYNKGLLSCCSSSSATSIKSISSLCTILLFLADYKNKSLHHYILFLSLQTRRQQRNHKDPFEK